jgi:hypothetical protein
MLRNAVKSAVFATVLSLSAVPASAQVEVSLPSVEVHVGHRAPPPLRRERIAVRPGPDYVWVNGAWDWQGNDWAWAPGRWERPSYRGARWVKARYRREGDAWRYEPGHWHHQKLVDGEDYRRWREEHGNRRDRDRHDEDRDRK